MEWIGRYWYVWLLVVGAVVALIVGWSAGPTPDRAGAPSPEVKSQDDLRQKFDDAVSAQKESESATDEKSTDTVIAEHQARLEVLENNPAPDESAALLSALGNLYKQKKRDYATAARYYEELLEKYPEWPGVNAIYHQLISCYTELEDQTSLRRLYRQMTEVFPPESKEYEYAKAALDGKL